MATVTLPEDYEVPVCAECGRCEEETARCEFGWCETKGCECVVERLDACRREPLDGHWLCKDHTPFHRGCPDCDPVMPWE